MPPIWVSLLAAAVAVAATPPVLADEPLDRFYQPYRADAVEGSDEGVPLGIHLLPWSGPGAWPDAMRDQLSARVRDEWPAGRVYGPVRAAVGAWLSYPLVTARIGDRVAIPVIEASSIPVRGALALRAPTGRRRVVLLIDASSSANAPILFRAPSGRRERITVLEAARRAVEHLLGFVDVRRVELGVIAFGESTWKLVAPGVSIPEARARLDAFRRERPRGEGRTDAVCALEVARDWLSDAPRDTAREIVLLTDGDLPHSGRFLDCGMARRRGSPEAAARCEARRNRSACPASHRFKRSDGASDLIQLASFARRARRDVNVHVLVFERDRPARPYRSLAHRTGGALVRVPSAAAIEVALPGLVARRIRGVWARNLDTGDETPNLYDPRTRRFDGALPLAPGPNDVELRVESGRGVASLYRYRIYSLPGALGHFLEGLRERNRDLGDRLREVAAAAARPAARRVEIAAGPAAAAVSQAAPGGLDEGSAR